MLSPILSALPYDKDPRYPCGLVCLYAPPFSLHFRTHRLHADQIRQNMGTSPNSSSLRHTYRVNADQTFFELISPFQNCPTNRVSGTVSKAPCLFLAHFPRFMLKRRRRCPNSTIPLLFFPIFVVVAPSFMTKQALCTLIFAK